MSIGTYDISVGTVFTCLGEFTGPAVTIADDGSVMKYLFNSIRYVEEYFAYCRKLIKWGD